MWDVKVYLNFYYMRFIIVKRSIAITITASINELRTWQIDWEIQI